MWGLLWILKGQRRPALCVSIFAKASQNPTPLFFPIDPVVVGSQARCAAREAAARRTASSFSGEKFQAVLGSSVGFERSTHHHRVRSTVVKCGPSHNTDDRFPVTPRVSKASRNPAFVPLRLLLLLLLRNGSWILSLSLSLSLSGDECRIVARDLRERPSTLAFKYHIPPLVHFLKFQLFEKNSKIHTSKRSNLNLLHSSLPARTVNARSDTRPRRPRQPSRTVPTATRARSRPSQAVTRLL